MLMRYGVANHLSIHSYQEISCAASRLKDDERHLLLVDERGIKGSFLPVVALYGANAAGKSNMVDAFRFMLYSIHTSFRNSRDRKYVAFRGCKLVKDYSESESASKYDCDVLIDGVRYYYEFSCTREEYVTERLYSFPNGSRTVLFERDFANRNESGGVYFGPSLRGVDKTLQDLATNRKSLFLSSVGQTTHETLKPIANYFVEHFVSVDSSESMHLHDDVTEGLSNPEVKAAVEEVLKQADFGISGLKVVEKPVSDEDKKFRRQLFKVFNEFTNSEADIPEADTEKKIIFEHRCDDTTFELSATDESTGTIHLLKLLVPTILSLREGRTLIVDEVTTTLHTKLSEELIKLFTDPTTNTKRAQFIFTTHDTNLLSNDVLRRDEIWFVQKSLELETTVYPLTDFRTRKSDNIENAYLVGRYGAVPTFGDLTRALVGRSPAVPPKSE